MGWFFNPELSHGDSRFPEMASIHDAAKTGDRQQVLSILANDPLAVHAKTEVRACPDNLLSGGKRGAAAPARHMRSERADRRRCGGGTLARGGVLARVVD